MAQHNMYMAFQINEKKMVIHKKGIEIKSTSFIINEKHV